MQSRNILAESLKPTSLLTKSPTEEQAFQMLTPFAFKKLQEELKRVNQYFLFQVEGHKFTVRYYERFHCKNHQVFWDGNTALCSCKNFEFWGYCVDISFEYFYTQTVSRSSINYIIYFLKIDLGASFVKI